MQLTKQTLFYCPKSKQIAVCRWDSIKKVLMFQNRSKDIEMSSDDYLNRRQTSLKQAKERGFLISEIDVPIGSKWPTLDTLKNYNLK